MAETQHLNGVSAHCQQSLRAGTSWKLHVYDLLVPQFSQGVGMIVVIFSLGDWNLR